uniref:PH domain-containing protein n=1 Tax=Macrostomum lignano TaxID=282301 RepID=A0A1I8HHA7_9PLAT
MRFSSGCRNSIPLHRRGRVLLAEGVLVKMRGNRPKRRHFFLFNDLLVYGSPGKGDGAKRLSKQRVLELKCLAANKLESDPNCFEIISKKKSFTVRTNTEQEAAKWIDSIKRCVARCSGGTVLPVANSTQLPRGTLEHDLIPMWVPDGLHAACMSCQQKFSLVNRRVSRLL